MNYYIRKNGAIAGPMDQADFLARLANGEFSATDEMSTDGRVWTRLGLTGFARSIQNARFVATPRTGAVVPDLTGKSFPPGQPPASHEARKEVIPEPLPPAIPQRRRSVAAKATHSLLAIAIVAAVATMVWLFLRPREAPEGRGGADGAPHRRVAVLVALGAYDPNGYNGYPPGSRAGSAEADLANMSSVCLDLGDFTDVVRLLDSDASVNSIRKTLADKASSLADGDEFLFFFSSHGGRDEKRKSENDTFLCAYDGLYFEQDLREDLMLFGNGVRIVAIISACHSAGMYEKGGFAARHASKEFDPKEFIGHMSIGPKRVATDAQGAEPEIGWIVSASKDQSSLRSRNGSGSLFASYAIAREGWYGGAADGLTTAVVSRNGKDAVKSADALLQVASIDVQDPCGKVTFLDLALFAVRKWKDVVWKDRGKDKLSMPQFANPEVLGAFVAGRTADIGQASAEAEDAIEAALTSERTGLATKAAPVIATFAASEAIQSTAPSAEPRLAPLPEEFAETALRATATGGGGDNADRAVRAASARELFAGQGGGNPAKGAVSLADPIVQQAIRAYVAPSPESQELLLINIEKSEHVRQKFADVAATTRFEYHLDNDIVNADSSIGRDADGTEFGRIRLYGGLVRMARVMGAVIAFGEPGRAGDENVTLAFLSDFGATIRDAGNKCSPEAMRGLFERHKVDPEGFTSLVPLRNAERFSNAIVESVLAHEFGHLAKGHLKGGDANHVVTQLEEKEADLFAATIAASIPEGQEVFAGQILSMLVFSFIDDGTGEQLRTHPVPKERVINAIRDNPEYAAAAGLTVEGILKFYKALESKKGGQP